MPGIPTAIPVKYSRSLIVALLSITFFKYAGLLFLSDSSGTYHAQQLVLFDVVPTFADIAVAIVLFAIKLDWVLAVVTFVVMFAYGTFRGSC